MSKYFNTDNVTIEQSKILEDLSATPDDYITPTQAHNTQIKKEIPQKPSEETDEISELIKKVDTQSKAISNTFKEHSSLEIFERLSQLTFLMMAMNDRLTSLEETIEKHVLNGYKRENAQPGVQSTKTPRELYEEQIQNNNKLDSVESVQNKINEGMQIPNIPDENTTTPNLEKMFPNLPSEAYQAAYNGLGN